MTAVKWAMLLGAAALAGPAAAQAVQPALTQAVSGTVLDVQAEGKVTRVPDVAVVRAGVVTQAATAAEASRENAARMAATIAALRRAGVAERDVRTARLQLEPQYRYGENQPPVIQGYQANNSVEIRLRDVARAGGVVDALVAAGANQVSGPDLQIDRPEAALDEARTDAVRIARARAELYARAAGLRVKRILAISEGGALPPPVPMPVMMRVQSADARPESAILPGEQELRVTVNVRFELE